MRSRDRSNERLNWLRRLRMTPRSRNSSRRLLLTTIPGLTTTHDATRARTTVAPQPTKRDRYPWSERFDCIFRIEGVVGSNPISATECVRGFVGARMTTDWHRVRYFSDHWCPTKTFAPKASHFQRGANVDCPWTSYTVPSLGSTSVVGTAGRRTHEGSDPVLGER
jgi:hypothetical protein